MKPNGNVKAFITRKAQHKISNLSYASAITNTPLAKVCASIEEHGKFETDLYLVTIENEPTFDSHDHPDDEKWENYRSSLLWRRGK